MNNICFKNKSNQNKKKYDVTLWLRAKYGRVPYKPWIHTILPTAATMDGTAHNHQTR